MEEKIKIRSKELMGAEISWFAPICDGDDRYLENEMESTKAVGKIPLIYYLQQMI